MPGRKLYLSLKKENKKKRKFVRAKKKALTKAEYRKPTPKITNLNSYYFRHFGIHVNNFLQNFYANFHSAKEY